MKIKVRCSQCDFRGTAPEKAAGRELPCPKCKAPIHVPDDSEDDSGDFQLAPLEDAPPPAALPAAALGAGSDVDRSRLLDSAGEGVGDTLANAPADSDAAAGKKTTSRKQRLRELDLQALHQELSDSKRAGAAMAVHAIDSQIMDSAVSDVFSDAIGERVSFTSDETIEGFRVTSTILQRKWALETIADPKVNFPDWIVRFGSLFLLSLGLFAVTLPSVLIALFLPLAGFLCCFAGAAVVLFVWFKWIRPIQDALSDYPHVRPCPEGAVSQAGYCIPLCIVLLVGSALATGGAITALVLSFTNQAP